MTITEAKTEAGRLIAAADRMQFDAERLDDADLPQRAAALRVKAGAMYQRASGLLEQHGVRLGDEDFD